MSTLRERRQRNPGHIYQHIQMNPELYQILCPAIGGILFALGGTDISQEIKGQKWVRRELFPLFLGIVAYFHNIIWWKCLLFVVLTDAIFRLPYGDKTPRFVKLLVFVTYPLPSLLFGFTWWLPICSAICVLCFFFSNWKPTEKLFPWALACTIIGFSVGAAVCMALKG